MKKLFFLKKRETMLWYKFNFHVSLKPIEYDIFFIWICDFPILCALLGSCISAGAAVIKYDRLGGWTTKIYLLTILEAMSKVRVLVGFGFFWDFWAFKGPPSHSVLTWSALCVCLGVSPCALIPLTTGKVG